MALIEENYYSKITTFPSLLSSSQNEDFLNTSNKLLKNRN